MSRPADPRPENRGYDQYGGPEAVEEGGYNADRLPDDQHREVYRVFVADTGVRVLVTIYLEHRRAGLGAWEIADVTAAMKGRDDGVWGPPLDEIKVRW